MRIEPTDQSPSRTDRVIIAGLILIQFAIFVSLFAFKSFWLDEILSMNFTDGSLGDLYRSLVSDLHPPGYFIVLWAWQRIVPVSEYSTRLLSLLLSIPTIPLVYLLVRKVWSREAALWSCAFVALSPFHEQFAAQARMYSGLESLAVLSTLLLLASEHQTGRIRLAYAASIVACIYFHYYGLFVLAAHMIYVIGRSGLRPDSDKTSFTQNLRDWLPALILILIFLLPWLAVLPKQLAAGTANWIKDYQPEGALFRYLPDTLAYFVIGEWHSLAGPIPTLLMLYMIIPSLTAGTWATLRNRDGIFPQSAIIPIMLIVPAWLAFTISQFKSIFMPRYLIEILPFFFALFGIAVSLIPFTVLRRVGGGLIVLVLAGNLVIASRDLPRIDWLNAARTIEQTVPAGELENFEIYCHDGNDRICIQYYMLQAKPEYARVPIVLRPYGDYRMINPALMPRLLGVVTQQPYDGKTLPPGYRLIDTKTLKGVSLAFFRRD